jgi:hypothetical protein
MLCERAYGIVNVPKTGRRREIYKDGNVQSCGRDCIGDEDMIAFKDREWS